MINFFRKKKTPSQEMLTDQFRRRYEAFLTLLRDNNAVLEQMADLEEKSSGDFLFDMNYLDTAVALSLDRVFSMITNLNRISHDRYLPLNDAYEKIKTKIDRVAAARRTLPQAELVLPLSSVTADMAMIAGGKMANIGEMRNRLHLPVPDGFVITSAAFHEFFLHQGLGERLMAALSGLDLGNGAELDKAGAGFQQMIRQSALPQALEEAINRAAEALRAAGIERVSVRSSALAEDGHFSFAGQYATYLNVSPRDIAERYRDVIASLFTGRALFYAASRGFATEETAMAVGVMQMVDAQAGGVLYSRDPNGRPVDAMIVNGAWGLAKLVVDGTGKADQFIVSRESGEVLEERLADKETMIAAASDGGVQTLPVSRELRMAPCLSAGQLRTLASYALSLEQHFGKPQDMEWTVDRQGGVLLLQSRPLRILVQEQRKPLPRRVEGFPLLIEKGVIASRGIGCGPVQLIRNDNDLSEFPAGAVLVARNTSTRFVTVMDRAAAIITDVGGTTGHMASLAREFGVPAILDTDFATRLLQQGQVVTVDAINCNVYDGQVDELLASAPSRESSLKETSLFHLLGQVMQFIVPLRLTDPDAPSFRPEACSTLHDITRFCHEMAMNEMFGMSDTDKFEGEATITLAAGVPMDAHMIDVGGGMRAGVEKALPEDILSVPYIPFLQGLRAMKWPEPRAADAKGFLGMMAHAASITEEQLQQTAIRSFAIVSDHYMNFSIRLGYHFSMVEAFAGETLNDNYIRFFFKGGGAATDRRLRRVRLIRELLEMMDFRVRVTEDVVRAVLMKFRKDQLEKRLEIMGRMTVFTKQLDMAMYNDDITDWYRDEFVRDHMQALVLPQEH